MDARQLEYFLAVVEHDGFGRAAQALHLAQPSLSQAIAGLERELGVRLFHRIGRGVVVSTAGRELIEPARQVLRDMRAVRATMRSTKEVRRGRVELVTMPSPGIEPLCTLTRLFAERYPGMTVGAEAAFTADEVVRKVKQGACELGLAGTGGPLRSRGVDVLALEVQEFVVVGAEGPGFPGGDPVPLSAMSGTGLIASPPGSLMRQVVEDILASVPDVRVVAEVAHRTSVLPLAMDGTGLAVVPAGWAPLARRVGARVARVDHPARLHIALVARPGPLTEAAEAFVGLARSHRAGRYLSEQQG